MEFHMRHNHHHEYGMGYPPNRSSHHRNHQRKPKLNHSQAKGHQQQIHQTSVRSHPKNPAQSSRRIPIANQFSYPRMDTGLATPTSGFPYRMEPTNVPTRDATSAQTLPSTSRPVNGFSTRNNPLQQNPNRMEDLLDFLFTNPHNNQGEYIGHR